MNSFWLESLKVYYFFKSKDFLILQYDALQKIYIWENIREIWDVAYHKKMTTGVVEGPLVVEGPVQLHMLHMPKSGPVQACFLSAPPFLFSIWRLQACLISASLGLCPISASKLV